MHYRKASGGSGSGSSTVLRSIQLTVASIRHDIVVLLPNQGNSMFTGIFPFTSAVT